MTKFRRGDKVIIKSNNSIKYLRNKKATIISPVRKYKRYITIRLIRFGGLTSVTRAQIKRR